MNSIHIAEDGWRYYVVATSTPDGVHVRTCDARTPRGQRTLSTFTVDRPWHAVLDALHTALKEANRE